MPFPSISSELSLLKSSGLACAQQLWGCSTQPLLVSLHQLQFAISPLLACFRYFLSVPESLWPLPTRVSQSLPRVCPGMAWAWGPGEGSKGYQGSCASDSSSAEISSSHSLIYIVNWKLLPNYFVLPPRFIFWALRPSYFCKFGKTRLGYSMKTGYKGRLSRSLACSGWGMLADTLKLVLFLKNITCRSSRVKITTGHNSIFLKAAWNVICFTLCFKHQWQWKASIFKALC